MLLQSAIMVTLGCSLNITVFNFSSSGEGFTSLLSSILLALFIGFNFWIFGFLWQNREDIQKETFTSNYKELYDGLKMENFMCLIFQGVILTRAIIFPLFLCFCGQINLI